MKKNAKGRDPNALQNHGRPMCVDLLPRNAIVNFLYSFVCLRRLLVGVLNPMHFSMKPRLTGGVKISTRAGLKHQIVGIMHQLNSFLAHAVNRFAAMVLFASVACLFVGLWGCGSGSTGGKRSGSLGHSGGEAPLLEVEFGNQVQLCKIRLHTQDEVVAGQPRQLQAMSIESIEDLRTGETIDLSASPIWRLDLRRLEELMPVTPMPDNAWAERFEIPHGVGTRLLWVDRTAYPEAGLHLIQESESYAKLVWQNLAVQQWHADRRGCVNVTVHLRYPDEEGPLHASIDVELVRDDQAQLDLALLTVAFPDLNVPPLDAGAESRSHSHRDEVLLAPFEHGYLVPDPILSLARVEDVGWDFDPVGFDFAQWGGLQSLYPGETSTQFLHYYDMAETEDAEEPWFHVQLPLLAGMGSRPSSRGGGQGLYLAAHDPDVNVKRLVYEPHKDEEQDDPGLLRMAIRNWVEFTPDRLNELKAPGSAGQLWQSYSQGPDSAFAEPSVTSGRDLHFAWPMVIEALHGDWLDATARYKRFFVDRSRALYRQNGEPLRIRDLPKELMPAAYRSLMAMVGLSEVVPDFPGGIPMQLNEGDNVRDFINFLREDWPRYQNLSQSIHPPWFAVGHGETFMINWYRAGKTAGTDVGNNPSRRKLNEFHHDLRQESPLELWDGRVMTMLNRDVGNWQKQVPGFEPLIVRRENGQAALRRVDEKYYFTSYVRPAARENFEDLLEESLSDFGFWGAENQNQLDLYLLTGQWSAAKPDYSEWHPDYPSDPKPERGVGGGNRWFEDTNELLRHLMEGGIEVEKLSPELFFSTERCSEALLYRNLPWGHRQTHPMAARDETGGLSGPLGVLAEPVHLTTYLFHEFSLIRGNPYSFSFYYGMPFRTVPLGTVDTRFFQQNRRDEQARGTALTIRKLAVEVLSAGVLPFIGVEISGKAAFEHDDVPAGGQSSKLDSLDDRLSSSLDDLATVGPDDLARRTFGPHAPMQAARQLIRARSQMRQFLVDGRRVRDPKLIRPEGEVRWWAEDLHVIRRNRLDLHPSAFGRYHGGEWSEENPGGIKMESLVVGTYVNDGELHADQTRALIVTMNTTPYPVHYQMQFDPGRWGVPAGEQYRLRAKALDLSILPDSGTALIDAASGPQKLPSGNLENPYLEGGQIVFWTFDLVAKTTEGSGTKN